MENTENQITIELNEETAAGIYSNLAIQLAYLHTRQP